MAPNFAVASISTPRSPARLPINWGTVREVTNFSRHARLPCLVWLLAGGHRTSPEAAGSSCPSLGGGRLFGGHLRVPGCEAVFPREPDHQYGINERGRVPKCRRWKRPRR